MKKYRAAQHKNLIKSRKSAPGFNFPAMAADISTPTYSSRGRWAFSEPKTLQAITSLFLLTSVLEGPLRYYLTLESSALLTYLPKILMIVSTIILIVRKRNLAGPALASIAAIISILWAMVNLPTIWQVLFGLWIAVPLLYGMTAGRHVIEDPSAYRKIAIIAYTIAVSGVLLSPFISFPWIGAEMIVDGKSIEVSRQWTAMGIDRHAGFSRASFNAASQILILSILLALSNRSRSLTILAWLLGGCAIALTTAKGPVVAWLILTLFFITAHITRRSKAWKFLWSAALWLILAIVVTAPASTLLHQYTPDIQSSTDAFLFASLGDRLTWMWPNSFNLLGDPLEWLLGRGIGGIGTAQLHFESTAYLAADNIFVYLAVALGPTLALATLIILTQKATSTLLSCRPSLVALSIITSVLLYGIVVNVIEEPFLAFFVGAAIASLKNKNAGRYSPTLS